MDNSPVPRRVDDEQRRDTICRYRAPVALPPELDGLPYNGARGRNLEWLSRRQPSSVVFWRARPLFLDMQIPSTGSVRPRVSLHLMPWSSMLDNIEKCLTELCGMPRQTSVQSATGQPIDTPRDVSKSRFQAVMEAAAHSGLLGEKSKRIGGRISPALLEQAKNHTGIMTDTDLIEFALATVALDDNFGRTFRETRGTVDPDLKLGF